jgi:hypothetical protein
MAPPLRACPRTPSACRAVSPVVDAVEESLNTLKYASRARAIRNRPVLNVNRQHPLGLPGLAAEVQVRAQAS